jgi:hypothetical protein
MDEGPDAPPSEAGGVCTDVLLSFIEKARSIPLTSGIALLIRDMTDTPRVRYGMIDRDRIRTVNEVLMRQSDRFSMAPSAPLLESIRRRSNLEPTPPLRVQMGGGPTSEGTPK